MLPSVGIDVTDIGRFTGLTREKDGAFLQKIFTPSELEYCFKGGDPAPHLAVRFAAKEAIIKALSCVGILHGGPGTIEIVRDSTGVPSALLQMPGKKSLTIQISLSHAQEIAVAVAVVSETSSSV